MTDPMNMDDVTPERDAIGVFMRQLRRVVESIVQDGFEGWNGTITCRKFKLHVDLTLEKE